LLLHPEETATELEYQLPRYAIYHSKDVFSTEHLDQDLHEISKRFPGLPDGNERQQISSNPELLTRTIQTWSQAPAKHQALAKHQAPAITYPSNGYRLAIDLQSS